jgi:hypothetical protein
VGDVGFEPATSGGMWMYCCTTSYGTTRSNVSPSASTVMCGWDDACSQKPRGCPRTTSPRPGTHQTAPTSASSGSFSSAPRTTSKRSSSSSRNGWNSGDRHPPARPRSAATRRAGRPRSRRRRPHGRAVVKPRLSSNPSEEGASLPHSGRKPSLPTSRMPRPSNRAFWEGLGLAQYSWC